MASTFSLIKADTSSKFGTDERLGMLRSPLRNFHFCTIQTNAIPHCLSPGLSKKGALLFLSACLYYLHRAGTSDGPGKSASRIILFRSGCDAGFQMSGAHSPVRGCAAHRSPR